ncbi:hypothetical protein ILUMI_17655 [Ignelater luminosus]|uniref:Uncharacterized protein n=1 Tax=Ignelater luminosus TaxID=2038154 RepID=A0A8K0CJG9_IGNLU|nr:hypothetical protein ILUMI_17655 [Ignelater luminosus]
MLRIEELPRPIYGSQPERTPLEEMVLPGPQCSIQSVSTNESEYAGETSAPQLFSQNELSDLIRDLNLSKQELELLASRLKQKNLLRPRVTITAYTTREKEILPYFKVVHKYERSEILNTTMGEVLVYAHTNEII